MPRSGREVSLRGRVFARFSQDGHPEHGEGGNPGESSMSLSGQKTRSVFERYNIVSNEDLKEAARRREAQDGIFGLYFEACRV